MFFCRSQSRQQHQRSMRRPSVAGLLMPVATTTMMMLMIVALVISGSWAAPGGETVTGQGKINLEDIERDTLLNEIRSKSHHESLEAQPTEHVPPTSVGPVHVQHHPNGHTGSDGGAGAVSHQTIVYHHVSGFGI